MMLRKLLLLALCSLLLPLGRGDSSSSSSSSSDDDYGPPELAFSLAASQLAGLADGEAVECNSPRQLALTLAAEDGSQVALRQPSWMAREIELHVQGEGAQVISPGGEGGVDARRSPPLP